MLEKQTVFGMKNGVSKTKWVYLFSEGKKEMRELLSGKGPAWPK
jgi:hypothetical protein